MYFHEVSSDFQKFPNISVRLNSFGPCYLALNSSNRLILVLTIQCMIVLNTSETEFCFNQNKE